MEHSTLIFLGLDSYGWLVAILAIMLFLALIAIVRLVIALHRIAQDAIEGFQKTYRIIESMQSINQVDHSALMHKLSEIQKNVSDHLQYIRDHIPRI
jgi:uncharacterized protein YoxC